MKHLFTISFLFFGSLFSYCVAQTAANPFLQIAFCNVTNDTLKFADIDKCSEVKALDKNLKIVSYSIIITMPSPKNKAKIVTVVQKNKGAKLSNESIALLKETKKRGAIQMTVKDVVAMDGDKPKGLAGMVIYFSNK